MKIFAIPEHLVGFVVLQPLAALFVFPKGCDVLPYAVVDFFHLPDAGDAGLGHIKMGYYALCNTPPVLHQTGKSYRRFSQMKQGHQWYSPLTP